MKERVEAILKKLETPSTVGDKMIWVGPNYSKHDLLADLTNVAKEATVTVQGKMTKTFEDVGWGYCTPDGQLIEETVRSSAERAQVAFQQMRATHAMLGASASPKGEQEFFDTLKLVELKLTYELAEEEAPKALHGLNPEDIYVPAGDK